MLAILPCTLSEYVGPEVFASISVTQAKFEPAGHSFHQLVLSLLEKDFKPTHGRRTSTSSSSSSDEEEVFDKQESKRRKAEWEQKTKKPPAEINRLKKLIDGENLYELLEIDQGATQDDIKKAYRRLALVYHPDKAQENTSHPIASKLNHDQLEAKFILLQDAYELLSNPTTRRVYDSSIPFDDSIPPATETYDSADLFIQAYHPVFQRNARWSTKRPVPSIPGAVQPSSSKKSTDTVVKKRDLDRFYNFWLNFSSWRDFSIHDEYDLNDADSREERRWMERKNRKIREKYQAAERARIRKLVEQAMEKDPRMVEFREAERAAQEAEKERRRAELEEKKRQEQELKRKKEEEEEAARLAEEARLEKEKKEREQARDRMRRLRALFRALFSKFCTSRLSIEEFQEALLTLDVSKGEELVKALITAAKVDKEEDLDSLPNDETVAEGVRKCLLDGFYEEFRAKLRAEAAAREEAARKAAEEAAEQRRRREEEGGGRKKGGSKEWSLEELSSLAKGLAKFPGGVTRRWQLIAQMIGTRSADEVIAKAKEMADTRSAREKLVQRANAEAFSTFLASTPGALKDTGAQADVAGQVGTSDASLEFVANKSAATAAGPSDWSRLQQQQLERAMAKYPSSMSANERWTAIASEVEGKTKKECAARFKYIREQLKNAKKI